MILILNSLNAEKYKNNECWNLVIIRNSGKTIEIFKIIYSWQLITNMHLLIERCVHTKNIINFIKKIEI